MFLMGAGSVVISLSIVAGRALYSQLRDVADDEWDGWEKWSTTGFAVLDVLTLRDKGTCAPRKPGPMNSPSDANANICFGHPLVDSQPPTKPLHPSPESWAVEKDDEEEADDLVRNANPVGKATTRVNCPLAAPSASASALEYIARMDHITLPQSRYTPPLQSSPRHLTRSYLRTRNVRHINCTSRRGDESVYWRLPRGQLPSSFTRLEQAGYDQANSLTFLGAEDMIFLMKYVYESQLPGPAAEEPTFDAFDLVDLTGCSLPTIPIVLHQNASSISCTTPRDLKLCSMAMKKVPQSVRHFTSLHRLDLSCNRIVDSEDAGLDRIPELSSLRLQDNRIEQPPWYKLPEECRNLVNLHLLDCRRNNILSVLDASNDDVTFLKFPPSSPPQISHTLTLLDVSYAKLSSLDTFDFSQLAALQTLKLDHNELRTLPDSLGDLSHLVHLSSCNNKLVSFPSTIGLLQRLENIDAHNNGLTELPVSLWNRASLVHINVASNPLASWHDPPGDNLDAPAPSGITLETPSSSSVGHTPRKHSNATYTMSIHNVPGRALPPLVCSLERLSIGENRLRSLRSPFSRSSARRPQFVLQELPPAFLRNLQQLETLYRSGNQLTSIPTEDLVKMTRLSVLFLNGNKFQTLPAELGKIPRYNIHNLESGKFTFSHPIPAPGTPRGDGLLLADNNIIVLLGQEGAVNSIARGKFSLNFDSETEYRNIGICSSILTMQCIAQLLLIPQATLFGQIMLLASLAVSWAYTPWLSSFDKSEIQRRLLVDVVLKRPLMTKYMLGTRTTMAVFVLLALNPLN
ncbi:uncharacterized protein HD556DRAFT_1496114 [Suillus plorans]|uniref:Uncharacterized protein n=1 Tax=Suillus plorans TaxID=116603 RepID=A0A9P7AGI9_9AGAM|nr:uncharacterized protein HD556DRAFT_1496114 [Suillus plorans]KAG1788881.1 hypothetical protein HD556DRAFT_1496114 [Suillus plorans]